VAKWRYTRIAKSFKFFFEHVVVVSIATRGAAVTSTEMADFTSAGKRSASSGLRKQSEEKQCRHDTASVLTRPVQQLENVKWSSLI
jgi:hypothetical protein